MPQTEIDDFARAKSEKQFTKAFEIIRPLVPTSLFIDGQNPLLLLHDSLSEGVHEDDDDECLARSRAIRLVLGGFAERLDQALKDDAEIRSALNALRTKKN